MIGELNPYPEMKASGVEWLGDVPDHWDIRRAKTLLRTVDVRSESGTQELLTVSSAHGIVPRRLTNVTMFKAESYIGHKLCWPGDLVINSLWAWSGGLGVSQHHGIVSTAYGVYRTRNAKALDPRFVHELVRSQAFHWELRVRSKGVWTSRLQLTDNAFLDAPFPLPPPSEQTAIVRFVDYADRRIRRYIRTKQKLIKLLEEHKQAIVHHAVTRGLEPDVPLKDSGVEFLGQVPDHWEVLRLKVLVTGIDQGVSPQAENRLADGNSWGVLKSGCVNHGVFREKEHKRLPDGFSFDPALSVRDGDVLVSRASGSPHLVGSVGLVGTLTYKLILSDKTFRPRFTNQVSPDFMLLAMNSPYFREQVKRAISGAEGLANNLPLSSLRSFVFAVPSLQGQVEITKACRKQLVENDSVSRKLEREISLLRELRTRLIADVVTGKLDVREVAARLPDEGDSVDEDDDFDEDEPSFEDSDLDAELEEIEA